VYKKRKKSSLRLCVTQLRVLFVCLQSMESAAGMARQSLQTAASAAASFSDDLERFSQTHRDEMERVESSLG